MIFRLEEMRSIKSDEKAEMKSIIEILKTRTRPHFSIKDTFIDNINIIAELKHSSPSAGKLGGETEDTGIIRSYIDGGASAISVLTEKVFFDGSFSHLHTTGTLCSRPLLCKDFIFFEEQVEAAYICGADMVLLISKLLDKAQLKKLYDKIKSLNMAPLVEIHEKSEIENIMFLNPELVLVNMRNLENLHIERETGIETLKKLPSSIIAISASGINSKDDISYIKEKTGTGNFLIGSALMQSRNQENMLRGLKNVY